MSGATYWPIFFLPNPAHFQCSPKPHTGATSISKNLAQHIMERLSDWWGYDEKYIERCLNEVLDPKLTKYKGATMAQTLDEIKKWVANYRKDLDREEFALRVKVVDFLKDAFTHVTDSPFKTQCLNRIDILRKLVESVPTTLKPDIFYHLGCGGKKRLTISVLSLEDGTVVLDDDQTRSHLADWKLEPASPNGDVYKIIAKVNKLELTGKVSDKNSSLLLQKSKKEASKEWLIYKHRNEEKYAIINDSLDCLLSGRDKDPLSARQDKPEDVWAWSLARSTTV